MKPKKIIRLPAQTHILPDFSSYIGDATIDGLVHDFKGKIIALPPVGAIVDEVWRVEAYSSTDAGYLICENTETGELSRIDAEFCTWSPLEDEV